MVLIIIFTIKGLTIVNNLRDCGEPRVWDPEQFTCVEKFEKEECGVTTVPPTTTTKRNTCTRHTSCQQVSCH